MIQKKFLEILESSRVETFSLIIISVYTLFILFDLVFSEMVEVDPNIIG